MDQKLTGKTITPRTGRRPGTSSTQQDILHAARKLFAEHGYSETTMRAIGHEAGVDASLVVHFFGNKANLLRQAVEWPFDPEVEIPRLVVDGRRNVGKHLLELVVSTWDREKSRNPILTLLRASMTEPQAAEMLREFLLLRLYLPLMERLGADQAELRADLVISQLMGLGIARYILRFEPMASASPAEVVGWIAPTVQHYLTGKVEPAHLKRAR